MPATSPKDVFLHLLAIVALYASGIAFLVLIFQYVNVLLPDLLSDGYGYGRFSGSYGAIRWSLSSLIIVFPVYLLTILHLNRSYKKTPSKANLWVRKWLTYFTLFAASLIIIGDLVTLLNNLLGGELTLRFIIKVLAVFFVAGSVFYYYLWELRKYKSD